MLRAFVHRPGVSRVLRRGALSFPPSARRYRERVAREIVGLRELNSSATRRLIALESRWSFQSQSLSRQGICFINEARHILNAIEHRSQKLRMLLELGNEQQLSQAIELLHCPVPITSSDYQNPAGSENTVHVHAGELPAVINIIVSFLERETDQMDRIRAEEYYQDSRRRLQGPPTPEYIA